MSTPEFTADLKAVPVDQLTYEQAREELLQVVSRMESGASTLEETLALWERGEALAQRCEQWLDGAQAKLEAARSEQP
ncbi:MAG: exodeoxyribonuclease VII small subunit [Rothia sp. (in: high G+C Gram-positive bacteria)]|nr:exodeoxyribonuclease VII small subunit [Rothia sp. (in: high G+C Gram-positive bacteria)]